MFKNKVLRILYLVPILTYNCNSVAQKSHDPIITKEGFTIYKYTLQKYLDTLGYHFKLRAPEISFSETILTAKWSDKEIKAFETKIDNIKSLDDLSNRDYMGFAYDLLEYSQQGLLTDRLPKILS